MKIKFIALILLATICLHSVSFASNYVIIHDTTMLDLCGMSWKYDEETYTKKIPFSMAKESYFKNHANNHYHGSILVNAALDIRNEYSDWLFGYRQRDKDQVIGYVGCANKNGLNEIMMAFYRRDGRFWLAGYNFDAGALYLIIADTFTEEQVINSFENLCSEYDLITRKCIENEMIVQKKEESKFRKK